MILSSKAESIDGSLLSALNTCVNALQTSSLSSLATSTSDTCMAVTTIMTTAPWLSYSVWTMGVALPSIAAAVFWVLQTMHSSIGIAKPCQKQLDDPSEQKARETYPLFRYLPQLKDRLAWRSLGGSFPTPIHACECQALPIKRVGATKPAAGSTATYGSVDNFDNCPRTVHFYVKREDLSSSLYGGNKVRTLQHQLAVIEAKLERQKQPKKQSRLLVFGSGGSNQVLATVLYALKLRLMPLRNMIALCIKDPPDLDNTLNMLSTLSLEDPADENNKNDATVNISNNDNTIQYETWARPLSLAKTLLKACTIQRNQSFIVTLGGNNPSGVLGQLSGALELAEQVQQGLLPKVEGIYLAVGSSCTITGLILGIALARKVGLGDAFGPGFKLHLVPIEDTLAMLHRWTGLYNTAYFARFVPITVRHSIHSTCRVLKNDLGGPDLLKDALAILEHETMVHADKNLVGKYGAHSEPSRACAQLFDRTAILKECTAIKGGGSNGKNEVRVPGLWLCGHFTAKAMVVLCDDLLQAGNTNKNVVFWQTKSRIQPRGTKNEWDQMQHDMPKAVQSWANDGSAESAERPGKVDLVNGSPEDYRNLMTKVTL